MTNENKVQAAAEVSTVVTMPEKNGVREPRPGTNSANIWQLATSMSEAQNETVAVGDLIEAAKELGYNEATVKTQYARWRKFHDITGRVESAISRAKKAEREEAKLAKAKEREEAKAKREAEKAAKAAEREAKKAEREEAKKQKAAERAAKAAEKEAEKKAKAEAAAQAKAEKAAEAAEKAAAKASSED